MSALNKKSVKDIDVSGKRVLVRCDFNVPLQDGKITSDKRIVASSPLSNILSIITQRLFFAPIWSRPKGEFKPEFSLAPVAARLSELLGQDVKMAKDVIGDSAKSLPLISRTAKSCSLRTCVSTQKRPRTIPHSRRLSPPLRISM